jgi:SAM-dependent methyltransferase
MAAKNRCVLCSSSDLSMFFELSDMPLHVGLLWLSKGEARNCPRGDIKLSFCQKCGFISNLAFDETLLEYSVAYDNSLHFSPFFQDYSRSLAMRLIGRYNLYNKDVIEIGCGKGDFLTLICMLSNSRGVGFDPSYGSKFSDIEMTGQITFIKDFFSRKYADYHADLICCRYVLEHIHNPTDFLTMLRLVIDNRSDTVLYFEVPNVLFILRSLSIWDIIYEHCSYFSRKSLSYVFTSSKFGIFNIQEMYDGQYVGLDAFPSNAPVNQENYLWDDHKQLPDYVQAFNSNCKKKLETWQQRLKKLRQTGQKAVAWGAGAKAVSFFNILKIRDQIEYIVDINPYKHGKYLSGTGQKIIPPEFLQDYQPDVVIIMNSIYKNEIQHTIKELGLTTEFLYA